MRRLNQSGMGHVALLLVVVVVAVVAFAGYRVWSAQQDSATPTETATTTSIQSKADLVETSSVLDDTSSDLNQAFDTSALDEDIDSLL